MEQNSQNGAPHTPLGIYTSRCDEKGRVRLPKEFEDFVRTFPEPEFFITSFDGDIGRIYPIAAWRENEKILAEYTDDPQAGEDMAFLAHYWGAVSEVDGQGRLLVPPVLRRKLGIEAQPVNLRFYNGGIDIYSESASARRLERATEAVARNFAALRKRGLK